jgi:L-ascorbate metabolism protein UlaG (beta-lactamase superfamily)
MPRARLPTPTAEPQRTPMKLLQLRSATCLLDYAGQRLLVDPMLAAPGAMPGFKLLGGGRRRNPLVPLPAGTDAALASATAVLLTHEHPDHFDAAGRAFARGRGLPVHATAVDAPHLRAKGLDARVVEGGSLGFPAEVIRARHAHGPLGYFLGPVAGYYLAAPGEPTVYVVGDAVLVDAVREAVERLAPEIIVAPAGSANVGFGGDILFSPHELETLVRLAPGRVVLNHLEALDHCPTTRDQLRARMTAAGLMSKVFIPEDGEQLEFTTNAERQAQPREDAPITRPGIQKWMTAPFSGA